MKTVVIVLFLLSFTFPSFAATIGGPVDIDTPKESLYFKERAVRDTLDSYEAVFNIKASVDVEMVHERKLSTSSEVTNLKMEGESYAIKFSNKVLDMFEPYVKIGSTRFELRWNQHDNDVMIETDSGSMWGAGIKAKILELEDYGIRLTLDAQYRYSDIGIDKAEINSSEATASPTEEECKIEAWHLTLLASKRLILPIGYKNFYIVPYTGITFTNIDVDVSFIQSTTAGEYSTYNATGKEALGVVVGCDIMPSLLSCYLLSFELRLINETAFSLGGTIKF